MIFFWSGFAVRHARFFFVNPLRISGDKLQIIGIIRRKYVFSQS